MSVEKPKYPGPYSIRFSFTQNHAFMSSMLALEVNEENPTHTHGSKNVGRTSQNILDHIVLGVVLHKIMLS